MEKANRIKKRNDTMTIMNKDKRTMIRKRNNMRSLDA
jgi:hypothetical protein